MFQARARQAWIHGVRGVRGVRTAGSDLGDFYKDDNGKLWNFERPGTYFTTDQWRASTDAYGGMTTEWRPLKTQTISDIDRRAELLGGVDKAIDDAIGKPKPTSTPKPSSTPTTPKAVPYVPSLTTKASDGSTSLSLGGYVVAAFVVGGLAYAARWAYLRGGIGGFGFA